MADGIEGSFYMYRHHGVYIRWYLGPCCAQMKKEREKEREREREREKARERRECNFRYITEQKKSN